MSNSVLSFVGKQVNHAADTLAKATRRVNASSRVFNYIRYCIQTVILMS